MEEDPGGRDEIDLPFADECCLHTSLAVAQARVRADVHQRHSQASHPRVALQTAAQ